MHDLMNLVAERVRIVSEGKWTRYAVDCDGDEMFEPKVSQEMINFATSRFLERKAKNPNLFDGPAMHLSLEYSKLSGDALYLAVGLFKYSVYDICRKEFIEKFGWDESQLPTGMGVNAVVVTLDSKIVMHDRDPNVDHKAKIGIIGSVYSEDKPFTHIQSELWEEVGLELQETNDLFLVGISSRLDERINHELTFIVQVPLIAEEVMRRWERAIDKKEGEVFFLECDPDVLHSYLQANYAKMLSTAFSGLVLAGRHMWGEEWSRITKADYESFEETVGIVEDKELMKALEKGKEEVDEGKFIPWKDVKAELGL